MGPDDGERASLGIRKANRLGLGAVHTEIWIGSLSRKHWSIFRIIRSAH